MANLIETMTKEDKQNLISFFQEMSAHPEYIKYKQLLLDRYKAVAESVMMSPEEQPYERGYAVGCLHSSTFEKDFEAQCEAQWALEEAETEAPNTEQAEDTVEPSAETDNEE